jgi:hypothetical protein
MIFIVNYVIVAEDKGFEPSEAFTSPVFKTGPLDQLWQSSTIIYGANDRNRTDTPKPELDFKSNASTCSATLAHLKQFKVVHLNWTGIIIDFLLFVKSFLRNI